MRPRLTARHGVLGVFALVTLVLLCAGALVARALLTMSLDSAAEQSAGREARLVANLGLAASLSTGERAASQLRLARAEYAVARQDLPLTGVVVWTPPARVRFAAGTGRADIHANVLPAIAQTALATGSTQVINSSEPGVGAVTDRRDPTPQ